MGRPTVKILVLGVLALALSGTALAAAAVAACEGVRPGATVLTEGTQCSLNFVFRGSDKRVYIGTAGHCISDESGDELTGEHSWGPRQGPLVRDGEENPIGRVAYSILRGTRDIALIRLNKSVVPNPSLCEYGGPTAINNDLTERMVVLNFYGNGLLLGGLIPARSIIAPGMPNPDIVHADGPAAPGDSGAGVISADGRAVGVLVTFGLHTGDPGFGLIGVTRLAPQLALARQATGVRFRLVKAPPG
jgi:hypothetical protein